MGIQDSKGFSLVTVIIVVAVVGIIGMVAYNVYLKQQDDNKTDSAATTQNEASGQQTAEATEAPEVKNSADLDKAQEALDSINVESNEDDQQLSKELSSF